MAQKAKFGRKDNLEFLLSVADVLLLDKDGNQLASATLKSHNMSQTVDTTEIRAGQANDVLATIKNNKTIEVTIEDVQQKHDFIAMMLGADQRKLTGSESVEAYVMPQGYKVVGTKITLPADPKSGEEVIATHADGTPVGTDGKITISSKEATLTGVQDGEIVYVSGYAYNAPVNSIQMNIASDKFAGSFKMILDEQVFDADMQLIARKQTVFHKVIPNDSFTLDGSAERAEKTTSYTFTVALEPGQEDLGYVLYIPEMYEVAE